MTRPIKFRAWDRENSCWVDPEISSFVIYPDGVRYIEFDEEWLDADPDSYIVSFYTGLKDKNGVEIYEGDIVAQESPFWLKKDGTPDKRWKGGKWLDIQEVKFGEYPDYASGWDCESNTFYGWNVEPEKLQYLEVIGNIWENKELLK